MKRIFPEQTIYIAAIAGGPACNWEREELRSTFVPQHQPALVLKQIGDLEDFTAWVERAFPHSVENIVPEADTSGHSLVPSPATTPSPAIAVAPAEAVIARGRHLDVGLSEAAGVRFWFLDAARLREAASGATLPRFQDVQAQNPGWLVSESFALADACSRKRVVEFCAVSHRWEKRACPDASGQQMAAVQEFLRERPTIRCVRQGRLREGCGAVWKLPPPPSYV